MPDSPVPTPEDLEQLLLGSAFSLTVEQVAATAGMSADRARTYWRALGFPDVGEAEAFTTGDAEILRQVSDLVATGALDEQTALRLVRALGRMSARLAEWQVQTLTEVVEAREVGGTGSGSRLLTAYGVAARVLPAFEKALVHTWRRHLGAASSRYVAAGTTMEAGLLSRPVTVGFVDMVSFTRMARGLTDDALATVVETFESVASDVVTAAGARLVKTLGDEVLFISMSPSLAVGVGLSIIEGLQARPGLPAVRVGMATGHVLRRLGDVFGTPVNLASRLTALADADCLLADEPTASALEAAAEPEAYRLKEQPIRDVPGIGPTRTVLVSRA